MKYEVTTRVRWEAAHRLISAYSEECKKNIHGHSYEAELTFRAEELNADGMVIDFKKLKQRLHMLIDQWDHALILHKDDPLLPTMQKMTGKVIIADQNPTAEWMAAHLCIALHAWKVRVWETRDNCATFIGKYVLREHEQI